MRCGTYTLPEDRQMWLGAYMRVLFFFIGSAFCLIGLFSFVGAFATWNTARWDPTYASSPKKVMSWLASGVVCLGLMTLFYLL
ncbi:Integral membrane protein OS=Streptomyces fumanus OX=67302 GN=GCM10018772_11200 PE=4 SV=1 [Streptomyces fumanus]|uniref:Uncharacterized protein n=1 Tax=Streptomyces fumanus TaxID=67302 RepID=A0A919A6J7_9ACTN|nr:hypothetical protein GCM10018772_11200 [Streptomyces fumanus]